ncbi:hypothetical protein [Xanthocytophaga agilis]|uniref:Uncharacterized protein n=1 Tax=Xanthocytophaga agilis TaxID=3048010 RepID=A0AAE3UFX4_9BACT|nr:hypothetical protein [Xanthocytophaga agilis]MDJ1501797.1 hypothetical protein [Xanthocytophaga agilis]
MSKGKSKTLFDLIKSLDKNEKRYFKRFMLSEGQQEDRKVLLLFDLINAQSEFDEDKLLQEAPSLKPSQLSNLKAYLYEKILQSIRQFHLAKMGDVQIREQIDFAQLLFNKRLYQQGLSCLRKAKKLAIANGNLELRLEIIKLEKRILLFTNSHGTTSQVDEIIRETSQITEQINNINIFSNLAIRLNSLYTRIGYIRNEQEYLKVKDYFHTTIPPIEEEKLSSIEKIYLYRLYVGYYFFIQAFENGYTAAQRLVALYESMPLLLQGNIESYLQALNSLLIAQNKLYKYAEFVETNQKLHSIDLIPSVHINESIRIRLLKYYYVHEINQYFMTGDFSKGIELIMNGHEKQILQLMNVLDKHSVLIFYYKIACLYFGAGQFRHAVRWMGGIINIPNADMREDLQCFARIITLIAHFELDNRDVIKYYIRSTYRFLLMKEDLHLFQKYILGFLKKLHDDPDEEELTRRFVELRNQLLPLLNSAYEKRAFLYFDMISWLESKIEKRSVQVIIQEKAALRLS